MSKLHSSVDVTYEYRSYRVIQKKIISTNTVFRKDKDGNVDVPTGSKFSVGGREFSVLGLCGKGAFSRVYTASERGEEVAIKISHIPKDQMLAECFSQAFEREVQFFLEIGKTCDKTNADFFVKFLGVINEPTIPFYAIVMSYHRYNLNEWMKLPEKITPQSIKIIMREILNALAFLSDKKIMHGDLKPDNCLIGDKTEPTLKLADFGLAHHEGATPPNKGLIQSRWWRSPEVAVGLTPYTTAIDMWSAGAILGELCQKPPTPIFNGSMYDKTHIFYIMGIVGLDLQKVEKMPEAMKTSVSFMVSTSYPPGTLSRIAAGNDTRLDFLQKMLDYNPTTRITPQDALKHPFLKEG
jgi:mitogen-activated protein kinase 15